MKVARHGALTHSLAFNQVFDSMFHDLTCSPCAQALLVRRSRGQRLRGGTKIPNPAAVKQNARTLRGKGNKRSGIMFSGRFDGGPKEAFLRATAVSTSPAPLPSHVAQSFVVVPAASNSGAFKRVAICENWLVVTPPQAVLESMGYTVLLVSASGGEKFGPQTIDCLARMEMMVAFCFEDYGEKTISPFCSFAEVEYYLHHMMEVMLLPLKLYALGDFSAWPPTPKHRDDVYDGQPQNDGAKQNSFAFTGDMVVKEFDPKEKNSPHACANYIAEQYMLRSKKNARARGPGQDAGVGAAVPPRCDPTSPARTLSSPPRHQNA